MSTEKVCSFDGCGRKIRCRGLCRAHYDQMRDGTSLAPIRSLTARGSECSFEGCTRPQQSRLLCSSHYLQDLSGRKLSPIRNWTNRGGQCTAKGCADAVHCSGLCKRHYEVRKRYGLDPEKYQDLLKAQDYKCGICGSGDPGRPNWSVDHDHSCCPGKSSCGACVRKLLCIRCNAGLGMFKDSPELLTRAISYLESHGKVSGTIPGDS